MVFETCGFLRSCVSTETEFGGASIFVCLFVFSAFFHLEGFEKENNRSASFAFLALFFQLDRGGICGFLTLQ